MTRADKYLSNGTEGLVQLLCDLKLGITLENWDKLYWFQTEDWRGREQEFRKKVKEWLEEKINGY